MDRHDVVHLADGRYRLLEQLGQGGMSVVWRARDEVLGRFVAVKVLASKLAHDAAFRHRIRVEARSAAALSHPHVTAVYDYGEATLSTGVTVPYVVMELVEGESLAERLARCGALPWQPAVATAAQVAAALAAAHAHGVVHRDVTTHNVMLTGAGAKVVDFGISALIGQQDSASDGSLLGTPAYLAPERLRGGPVSPAADVYALGLVLYRSLTGRLPWPAESTAAVLRAHLWTEPAPLPPLDGLPAAVVDVCRRCLAKTPQERPTSAEVARALGAAVGLHPLLPGRSEPVTRHPVHPLRPPPVEVPGPRPPAARPAGRRLRAAATSVGLVLAAAAGWAASERSTPERTVQAAAPAPAVVAAPETAIGCRVRYHVRRDSGTRFDAAVTVTNTGTAPIGTWDLEFALRGDQRIVSVRSGDVDQSGRTVVVRPSAAVALPAGESANLVLSGRYTESNRLPTTFLVDGRRCTASVSTVAVDPAPSGGEGTVSAAGPAEPAPRRNRAGRPSVRPSPDDADRPRTEPPTGGTAAAADDTARPRGPARPKANRSPGGKGSAGRPTMI